MLFKKMQRRAWAWRATAVAAGAWMGAAGALAQPAAYPSRPVTLVVPFPPGGSSDTIGRAIAPRLGEKLGQPVVIDNRPGGGTAVAAGYVARSAPDGYTLLIGSGSMLTLNPAVRRDLPYDSVKSFEQIGLVSRAGMVLLAGKDAPFSTVAQVQAAAKKAPGQLPYASFGAGTASQFAAEMAWLAMGVQLLHVPCKGSAPMLTDLIGGQLPLAMDTVVTAAPQIRAGKVRAIAVASPRRLATLPQVPTFAEAGFPDVVLESWGSLIAPRGLPPAVHAKLEKALAETMADPGVRKALADQGVEAVVGSAAQANALLERELPLMRAVAARARISAD
ncbi:Bug family tripartite tricarboxylate transporter substrate binding protein [Paracidovorax cattleyae]|uniref:Tripartite-type tricarboxylate transporter, receptor component TctC n=1 Tax=Paracidovorax cattleyae TaxID=80868 RepID=A0A1H0VJM4_9BURK|nr:tripartite tricarboxylate transporter substrate binding protein [Paracidovorax cattleyae]AVS72749.1 tripartite tricarboxylate transporter substrate binding protein [Paracidovorax cattleyae]SDP78428.1 Tripartite-type tricarboxylate transporter, receptor component TctC [Paracidovorax cattleyae]